MSRLRYALGLALALGLPVVALADQVRGLITRIDLKKNEIVIEGRGPARGQLVRLKVDSDTQVFVGREVAKLEDLDIGKRVRIVFEHKGKQAVAQTIRVPDLRKVVGAVAGAAGNLRPGAPEPPQPAGPESPAPTDANTVTGILQRVALTDREIVVVGPGSKGPRTETTIAVPEKVSIKRGEGAIAFDALKEGEQVTITIEKQKGRLTAVSIQAGSVPAATPAPPPAPEPGDSQPSATPRRPDRPRPIPRLRQTLRMLDWVLQQMDPEQGEQEKDERP